MTARQQQKVYQRFAPPSPAECMLIMDKAGRRALASPAEGRRVLHSLGVITRSGRYSRRFMQTLKLAGTQA